MAGTDVPYKDEVESNNSTAGNDISTDISTDISNMDPTTKWMILYISVWLGLVILALCCLKCLPRRCIRQDNDYTTILPMVI